MSAPRTPSWRGEVVGRIDFVPPEELRDAKIPGMDGKLFALRDGHVLLVVEMPENATAEQEGYVRTGLMSLVNDGIADSAIFVPHGWQLKVGKVSK